MDKEKILAEILNDYLVKRAHCRTIKGAKYIIPEIVKQILNSLSDGWISVEDELPEEKTNLHLWNGEKVFEGRAYFVRNLEVKRVNKITHWIPKPPLPAPPEDN